MSAINQRIPIQEVKFYNQFRVYFDINEELVKLIDNIFQENTIKHNNNPLRGTAIFLITKAIKTNAATWHLSADGYGEDAGLLVRSLFNLVINLYYISSEGSEDRARRFIAHHAFARGENLQTLKKWPEFSNNSGKIGRVENKILNEAKRVCSKYKFKPKKSWSGKSILEMAKSIDSQSPSKNNAMEKNYDILYNYLSDFEHSNIMASGSYLKADKKGWYPQINPSDNLLKENLATSTGFLLMVLDKFCDIFDLEYKTPLEDILKKLQKIGKDKNVVAFPEEV